MSYIFKEINTPLKYLKIRFFRECNTNTIFVKFFNNHRKPLTVFTSTILVVSSLLLIGLLMTPFLLINGNGNSETVAPIERITTKNEVLVWAEYRDKEEIIEYYKTKDTSEIMTVLSQVFPKPINKDYIASSENILSGIISLPPHGDIKFDESIDWHSYNDEINSKLRLLHGHFFLADMVNAYKESKDEKYIYKGYDIIESWMKQNSINNTRDTMAWHDEATANRLTEWILFFDSARTILTDEQLDLLFDNIYSHAQLLTQNNFYSNKTNHGMYQDLALIIFSKYFSNLHISEMNYSLAKSRLNGYFDFIYSDEGVHLEHSPSYHFTLAKHLNDYGEFLLKIDKPFGEKLLDLYKKSAIYGAYIIKPDGYLPQIGDTQLSRINGSIYQDDPSFQYTTTLGEQGVAPEEKNVVFPDAGYAIFRDWEKDGKGNYILFNAAYHTSYHHHSDDLSVWIYSDGDIITEAGPYGYEYEDEYNQYAYSSFAHNTLIVDGEGLPRTSDPNKLNLTDYNITDNIATVTGENKRYLDVTQLRTLEYDSPKNIVSIKDQITSDNNHDYQLLWHLAPDISPIMKDNQVELYRDNSLVAIMNIVSDTDVLLSSVKGQTEPYIQGWYFERFYGEKIPTNVITINFNGNANVTTEIELMN